MFERVALLAFYLLGRMSFVLATCSITTVTPTTTTTKTTATVNPTLTMTCADLMKLPRLAYFECEFH
jgi:hypothetical protein